MPAQPGQVSVFDAVLAATVFMYPTDAVLNVNAFPARYSLVTSGVAPVVVPGSGFNSFQPGNGWRNVIEGGDFTTNPWQRGTSFTAIAAAATYTADRWAARGSGGSSISVSRVAMTGGNAAGLLNGIQFGRAAANADVNPIYLAQEVESQNCYRLQGQQAVLSFYAYSSANFSAALGNLTALVTMGTGVDEGITKAINLAAAGFAGYATLAAVGGVAVNPITPQITRYFMAVNVPLTATELAVLFTYTPVGVAGAADNIVIGGVQLEVGSLPSAFEHRDQSVETAKCQRFAYMINEPANGVNLANGMNTTAAIQNFVIPLPQPMRIAPTVTVVAGTFKTNQASALTATTISALTPHTNLAIGIAGNSAGVAGQSTILTGGGGAGTILASADL